ncbi:MAG: nitrous oxide reductase family maturation protein NosD [Anaerobacillus sp.]|uniref:right-handed parallel beta-helix repeat-containing protein n=1 Tax=Anaerobacillus sp. TaxID=1872506 RepID=UPI00391D3A06
MNDRCVLGWNKILLFFMIILISTICLSSPTAANVSISELIIQAEPGEKIIIPEGTYEEVVIVTKPLEIIAEGVSIINHSDESAIQILSDLVSITGITVQQNSHSPAIVIDGNDNRLNKLKIINLGIGIKLNQSSRNVIENSHIERNHQHNLPEPATSTDNQLGNGIDLYGSHDNILRNNTLINQLDGYYIVSSLRNIIENNNVTHSRYGFHLMSADGTELNNNYASNNITGTLAMNSANLKIINNTFVKQNYHVHSQGLMIYDVNESIFKGNLLAENIIGISVDRSSNNNISENKLQANFVGFQIESSMNNAIIHNDFFTNVIQARTTDSNQNIVRLNYWDTHTGLDFTGNGVSELAFQADPIFLNLVDKQPPYQLLAQSPGMLFLQLLFDMDDTKILKDTAPLMEAYSKPVLVSKSASPYDVLMYVSLAFGSILLIIGGRRI